MLKKVKNSRHIRTIDKCLEWYLKRKTPDCIFYSEDGTQFKVHKEFLCQTKFLREILSSSKEHCCQTIEIFCPCSSEDLNQMTKFLYAGEIGCDKEFGDPEVDLPEFRENLHKIFGFPKHLKISLGKRKTLQDVHVIQDVDESNYVREKNALTPKQAPSFYCKTCNTDALFECLCSDTENGSNTPDMACKFVHTPKLVSMPTPVPQSIPEIVHPRLFEKPEFETHHTLLKNVSNIRSKPAPVHLLKARFSRLPLQTSKLTPIPSVKKSVLKKSPTLALDRLDSDLDLDVFQDKSVEIRGKYLYLCPQKLGGIFSKFFKVGKCFWHCEV